MPRGKVVMIGNVVGDIQFLQAGFKNITLDLPVPVAPRTAMRGSMIFVDVDVDVDRSDSDRRNGMSISRAHPPVIILTVSRSWRKESEKCWR